jgi:hypothetical protein
VNENQMQKKKGDQRSSTKPKKSKIASCLNIAGLCNTRSSHVMPVAELLQGQGHRPLHSAVITRAVNIFIRMLHV